MVTMPNELPPHGTRARYQHRSHPCHKSCCCTPNTQYQRVYRERTTPSVTVTAGGMTWEQLQAFR
jgi:hypothetical protein